ncbi:MAG: PilZ domain-containing protein [Deltaproteobacteria bacterium]|nr:PilZ domain-containing protein [Deltaproteobacteria bacterium]
MVQSIQNFDKQRRYPRFSISVAGLLRGEDGVSKPCMVENISANGAFICDAPLLHIGEEIQLVMRLPDQLPFVLNGTIVRQGQPENTYGIMFKGETTHVIDSEAATLWALSEMSHSLNNALIISESIDTCRILVHDLYKFYCSAVAVTTLLDAIEWLLASGSSLTMVFATISKPTSSENGLFEFIAEEYPHVKKVLLLKNDVSINSYEKAPYDITMSQPWTQQQLSQILSI